MWRYGLEQSARALLSLVVALALAALLLAASRPLHGLWPLASEFGRRFVLLLTGRNWLEGDGAAAAATVMAVLPQTLKLLGAGALVAIVMGAPLGLLLAAIRGASAAGQLLQILAALPAFAAALLLLWLSNALGWHAPMTDLALAALLAGCAGAGAAIFALRRSADVALARPYRKGLAMLGLGAFDIDLHYALPEVIAGLLSHLDDVLIALIGTLAVAEWTLRIRGAAALLIDSVAARDWNAAALLLLIFAAMVILIRLAGTLAARAIMKEPDA